MSLFISLILGTLASEDLTCLAAGLLIQQQQISGGAAVVACALGILLGDVGLWGVGRVFGRVAMSWGWIATRLPERRFEECRVALRRRAGPAIVASRFLPGTRTALYVTAGILNVPASLFARWSVVAVSIWTPAIVLGAAGFGHAITPAVGLLSLRQDAAIVTAAGGVLVGIAALRAAITSSTLRRFRGFRARAARWSRWEFWPMSIFYLPVAGWIAWLAFRHRGLTTMTAANPGIPDGGTVGESKFEILSRLPPEWTVPSVVVHPAPIANRVEAARQLLREGAWNYPVVLKPDVGERGAGVRLVHGPADLESYLAKEPRAVVIQPYHPGPFEAGVFYYRMPHWSRGRIFSITDKRFPVVIGDGCSTLEELIWTHPRYRMQARLFLHRHEHARRMILGRGERFQLAIAGNHAQGTVFCDGRHLITPALERRIDEIACAYDGFFVGRFDVRYRDVERFKSGDDLAIVELNGATAESTNIYDPDGSLIDAYRQLFRQWSIVFAIGAANRAAGTPITPVRRFIEMLRVHLKTRPAFSISD